MTIGGLGPIPSLLLTLYAGAAFKHIYWVTVTNKAEMRAGGGVAVGVYNFLMNAVASLGVTHALSRALASAADPNIDVVSSLLPSAWPHYAGATLFLLGVSLEMYSEHTRTRFKQSPANKGKVDDTAAFGIVRHPNYAGYLLWRTGIALASGSLATTLLTFALQFGQFAASIPDLASYMSVRYGQEWEAYTKRVPYRLIPFVY